MIVLSLFDGISCGQVALQRAGIEVETYFASEIDKYAIKVTQNNFPTTIQLGDVTNIDVSKLPKIDLLIGGSPCQGFSFAGKQLNFNDPRSKLFFEYVRILKELQAINPDIKFLLENVKMKAEYQNIISQHLGVEPILINSALVSAQNRNRLYWTNIPNVTQPEDKGILLKDIIEDGSVDRDKSYCIDSNYFKGGNLEQYFNKSRRQLVFKEKSNTVRSSGRGSVDRHEWDSVYKNSHHRKLTPIECERLQTLPDNHTQGISNTQRYKALGNGWTVDVIAYIFKGLK